MLKLFYGMVWMLCLLPATGMATFKQGETLWLLVESPVIRDDTYARVVFLQQVQPGWSKVNVKEVQQGHDYGVTCFTLPANPLHDETQPLNLNQVDAAWEMLDRDNVSQQDILVQNDHLMSKTQATQRLVRRNNLLTTFERWLSDHPMLNAQQVRADKADAQTLQLHDLAVALHITADALQATKQGYMPKPVAEQTQALQAVWQQWQSTLMQDTAFAQAWKQVQATGFRALRQTQSSIARSGYWFRLKALHHLQQRVNPS